MSTEPKITDKSPLPNHSDCPLPLMAHLQELRERLIWCVGTFFFFFIVAYAYADKIFLFLVTPFSNLVSTAHHRLIYTGLAEAFTTYIKVAFYTALSLSIPVIFYHLWRFLKPGLFRHERFFTRTLLTASPLLFLMGSFFAYFFIIPMAWAFFLHFEVPGTENQLPIVLEPRVHEYLGLTLQILFAFGFSFQMPILLILMAKMGWVSVEGLRNNRKYAFLVILIFSAFLTPPDVLSMVGLALPLYGLYEGSLVLINHIIGKTKTEGEDCVRYQLDP